MEDKERRQHQRIKKTLYVHCRHSDIKGAWDIATILNISETGLCALTTREFSAGNILELKISTFLKPKPLNLLGKVVSCERKPEGRSWIARISFTEVDKEDKEDEEFLKELIQIFQKKE